MRRSADNGVSAYHLTGDDRDTIERLVRAAFATAGSAREHARLAKLWRLFGSVEGCADRPDPSEWR